VPSPFPGFDPYLEDERFWHDFHERFITYAAEALAPRLPPRYRLRIDERSLVTTFPPSPPQRVFHSDIAPTERTAPVPSSAATATAAVQTETEIALDEPVIVELVSELVQRQSFIKIVDRTRERLVTIIELLSLSNKRAGEWRAAYLQKQLSCLEAGVNLVEIDLLRQGEHTVAVPAYALSSLQPFYGIVSVWRGHLPCRFEIYPITLPKRLPRIAIPLLPEDKDVGLDLRWVFDRCYDVGRYNLDIDYTQPPSVPLTDEERKWLDGWLKEKGLRPKGK
jgi:hypothetical protein